MGAGTANSGQAAGAIVAQENCHGKVQMTSGDGCMSRCQPRHRVLSRARSAESGTARFLGELHGYSGWPDLVTWQGSGLALEMKSVNSVHFSW